MAYSLKIKTKALNLRKQGFSLKEVSKKLNIAKSTASVWLTNVVLNKKAQTRLKNNKIIGQYKSQQIRKKKREKLLSKYQKTAVKQLSSVKLDKNLGKLISSLLFWCEGVKNEQSHVQFINSDPKMIKTFIGLLRSSFTLDEKKFRVLMHLHEYHNEQKQKEFWAKITGIPQTQFTKTYWKSHTKKRKRNNYQGCIRISYYNADIARQLYAWYNVFANKI